MRSILRLHLMVIKTPENVHKICFWVIWSNFDILTFDFLLKPLQPGTRLFFCRSICVHLLVFVNLVDMQMNSLNYNFNFLLGGLSLHLNHLIASRTANYDWPFETLPFGLFWSNLDTRDLETYSRTYSGHFWNMSIFDDSRAIWVLFRKWVVSENQSFLDEGAIITPLSV